MHVLITGTSHGLGYELARQFIRRGYTVTGTTHDEDHVDDDQLLYNANDPAAHMKLCKEMRDRELPPVDLLINNAGTNAIRHFENLTLDFVEYIMRVNCHAPVMLVRELLSAGQFGPQRDVINIVSDAAWRPMRHSYAYNASKAAFDMATRQMARELTRPSNFVIVAVRPGKMSGTRMSAYIEAQVCEMRGWTKEQAQEYAAANSVTGREAKPADVARFVYELWENPLFRTMSGACVDLVG